MNLKKLTALLLAGILLLAGCRKSGTDPSGGDGSNGMNTAFGSADPGVLTHVFRGVEIPLPEGWSARPNFVSYAAPHIDRVTGEIVCFAQNGEEAEDDDGKIVTRELCALFTISAEAGVVKTVPVSLPDGQSFVHGAFEPDELGGAFICLAKEAGEADDLGNRLPSKFFLNRVDPATGETVRSGEITPLFTLGAENDPYFEPSSLAMDPDGDIWIGAGQEALVVNREFARIASFTDLFSVYNTLAAAPDGSVWTTGGRILDKSTGQVKEKCTIPGFEEVKIRRILFCDDYDFCFETEKGVYGATKGDTITTEEILSYPNSNLDASRIVLWAVLDPDHLLCAEESGRPTGAWWETAYEPALYTASGDVDLSALTVLEVALSAANAFTTEITEVVVDFNRTHPDCRVNLRDYTQYASRDNPNGGVNLLGTDLTTGIYRPDVVIGTPTAPDMQAILTHKLYLDLAPWVEKDDTLNRETLFGAIQRAFSTEEGGLWGLASGFDFCTLYGPRSVLGAIADKEVFTFDDLFALADRLPGDAVLMDRLTQRTAALGSFRWLLGDNSYKIFIDGNACSFDSPAFIRWLEFVKALPTDETLNRVSPVDAAGDVQKFDCFYNGKVALARARVYTSDELFTLEAQFGTDDYAMIGYPESAPDIQIDTAFCVMASSEHPDLAWELVSSLVDRNQSTGIPALKSWFDKRAQGAEDYERIFIFPSGTVANHRDPDHPTRREDLKQPGYVGGITREEIDALRDYIDNRVGEPLREQISEDVRAIIREEISAYLGGVGTAEDCAKKIQSRVSIWLAEHS